MFDASGVRRQAGEQAIVLNQLVADFKNLVEDVKSWPQKEEKQKRKELKELLGHKPIVKYFLVALPVLSYFSPLLLPSIQCYS